MASFEDMWQPAATIAAALIARLEPGRRCTPEEAVALYHEVLAAMRNPPSAEGDDPMPFSV